MTQINFDEIWAKKAAIIAAFGFWSLEDIAITLDEEKGEITLDHDNFTASLQYKSTEQCPKGRLTFTGDYSFFEVHNNHRIPNLKRTLFALAEDMPFIGSYISSDIENWDCGVKLHKETYAKYLYLTGNMSPGDKRMEEFERQQQLKQALDNSSTNGNFINN
jgi:hypothetical protein